VAAEIIDLKELSAHAGQDELLRWLSGFPAPPRQVYLTHGEPPAANALQAQIQAKFGWKVDVAQYLQTVEL
jgi:metallo-beta-lactamase family protein